MSEFEITEKIKSGELEAYKIRANYTFPSIDMPSGVTEDNDFVLVVDAKKSEKKLYRAYKDYYLDADVSWLNKIYSKKKITTEMIPPEDFILKDVAYDKVFSGFSPEMYVEKYTAERVSSATREYNGGLGFLKTVADNICKKDLVNMEKQNKIKEESETKKKYIDLMNKYGFYEFIASALMDKKPSIESLENGFKEVGITNFRDQTVPYSAGLLATRSTQDVQKEIVENPLGNKDKIDSLFKLKINFDKFKEKTGTKLRLGENNFKAKGDFDEVNLKIENILKDENLLKFLRDKSREELILTTDIDQEINNYGYKLSDEVKEYELVKEGFKIMEDYFDKENGRILLCNYKDKEIEFYVDIDAYKDAIDLSVIDLNEDSDMFNLFVNINGEDIHSENNLLFTNGLIKKLEKDEIVSILKGVDLRDEDDRDFDTILNNYLDYGDNFKKVVNDYAYELLVENKIERKNKSDRKLK